MIARLTATLRAIWHAIWPPADIIPRGPEAAKCEACGQGVGQYHKPWCKEFVAGRAHILPKGMNLADVQAAAEKNRERLSQRVVKPAGTKCWENW